MTNKHLNILFLGDIFGEPGIEAIEKTLPKLIQENNIDFVFAQAENVSGRKGFVNVDYLRLKKAGVNAFTLGNHVWARKEILEIIANDDLMRPANIDNTYPGMGSRIFKVKGTTLRITALMGIQFNKLMTPWREESANSFFDCVDQIISNDKSDFHVIDFHGETTSEKAVLGLYLDGKISAMVGTHTHVQTNDDRVLPNGTLFITDAGMCGPKDSAIGANFLEVYENMRYGSYKRFCVSQNETQINGVVLQLNEDKLKNKIYKIRL